MPTFLRAPQETLDLVNDTLFRFAPSAPRLADERGIYQEIIDEKVHVDVLMAYGEVDPDSGERIGDAITHHGIRALGLFSVRNLKLRSLGLGDCEIMLDGDWWKTATDKERIALVDHELFHLDFKRDKAGMPKRDDLGRPCLKCRPHTHEFGWFGHVAERHGNASQEVKQAAQMVETCGQIYWPDFFIQPSAESFGAGKAEAAGAMARDVAAGLVAAVTGTTAEKLREGGSVTITGGGK